MAFSEINCPVTHLPIICHWLELGNYHCNLSLSASFSTWKSQAIVFFPRPVISYLFGICIPFIIYFISYISPPQMVAYWYFSGWIKIKLDFKNYLTLSTCLSVDSMRGDIMRSAMIWTRSSYKFRIPQLELKNLSHTPNLIQVETMALKGEMTYLGSPSEFRAEKDKNRRSP